jgi:REP element-mobilizing transposase RayT
MGKRYLYKKFWRGNLPHFHPPGATLFITFRLRDSIPQIVVKRWKAQKQQIEQELIRVRQRCLQNDSPEMNVAREDLERFQRKWFAEFEQVLDKAQSGLRWLQDERAATILAEALHYRDGAEYRHDAYCIMSNHVHLVITPHRSDNDLHERWTENGRRVESEKPPLDAIMQSLKGYTARKINLALGRSGRFWEEESYDHVVRDDAEYGRIIRYVLQNPVKAGLVKEWSDWAWNYVRVEG